MKDIGHDRAHVALLILIALATFDLRGGVANDAVNFLNSACGSKAAPRRIILLIAVLGVALGALTSTWGVAWGWSAPAGSWLWGYGGWR